MIETRVEVRGPAFDGRAAQAVDDYLDEAKGQVADEGVKLVHIWLGLKLQNPTGYYESQIVTDRQQDDRQVHDSGVVYGAWLEGVSSRNQSTSFAGYSTFRVVAGDLQDDAGRIAEAVLDKHIAVMNG